MTLKARMTYAALAVGTASLLSAGSATAAEQGYFGANLALLEYSVDSVDETADLTAGIVKVGGFLNEYVSGEIRLGVGLGDDNVNVSGTSVNVELETLAGGYIRGGYPVTKNLYPYVIAGITRGELKASASGIVSQSSAETDTSFGLGVDLAVAEGISINLEYMNWYDKDEDEITGFSIGASKSF
jgi:opacity protein-like surface antigen